LRSFSVVNMFIIVRERLDKVCDIRKNIKESIVVSIFKSQLHIFENNLFSSINLCFAFQKIHIAGHNNLIQKASFNQTK
jgi:hypothetical protein